MDKLREDYRTVLNLRIMKGYSVSETAKILDKSEAAVRNAQYRALLSLAQILDREDYRFPDILLTHNRANVIFAKFTHP